MRDDGSDDYNHVTVSTTLTPTMQRRVDMYASILGLNRSQFIREAIYTMVEKTRKGRRKSDATYPADTTTKN